MPPDVREAKDICQLIIEKLEGVTGSEDKLFAADEVEEEDTDLNEVNEAIENEGGEVIGTNDGSIVGPDLNRTGVIETHGVGGLEGRGVTTGGIAGTRVAVRAIRGSSTSMISPRPGVSYHSFYLSVSCLLLVNLTSRFSKDLF
jgi:hypothetical protein